MSNTSKTGLVLVRSWITLNAPDVVSSYCNKKAFAAHDVIMYFISAFELINAVVLSYCRQTRNAQCTCIHNVYMCNI